MVWPAISGRAYACIRGVVLSVGGLNRSYSPFKDTGHSQKCRVSEIEFDRRRSRTLRISITRETAGEKISPGCNLDRPGLNICKTGCKTSFLLLRTPGLSGGSSRDERASSLPTSIMKSSRTASRSCRWDEKRGDKGLER